MSSAQVCFGARMLSLEFFLPFFFPLHSFPSNTACLIVPCSGHMVCSKLSYIYLSF